MYFTYAHRFRINLHDTHQKTGLTIYRVSKLTGINVNTIAKYVNNGDVITPRLEGVVVDLAQFYGVDWRSSAIVDTFEVGNETQGS